MENHKKYSHFHRKVFWSVLAFIALLMASFIVVLYINEKTLKEDILINRLSSYSDHVHRKLNQGEAFESAILPMYSRTTLFDLEGKIIADSQENDISLLGDQHNWQEIRHAKTNGTGFSVRRRLDEIPGTFFYYAKRYDNYIIRSALPFNISILTVLRDNLIFFTVIFSIILILGFVFYKTMHRLGENINWLNDFAKRADRDEVIQYSNKLSRNELGETSRHIVQIYNRLMQTKKALEVEKERVFQQQEEQVRIKRQLTQNVAHELKTPVSSIQGYLETIISTPDIPEDVKNNFIEKGYAQCKRLSSLLHDITYLSRIDEAPELIEKELIDISEIIRGVINDVSAQVAEKEITINNSTDSQTLTCLGSPSLIYSIFRNLIDNTIAYAGEKLDVYIDCYKEDSSFYYFSYADNGVGVSEEHIQRIFERFYRLDKGRSRKLGGTGLGLAIVKNAIIFHGGTVNAKRYCGNGLEFVFTIKKQ